jgi:hypothetical protein
MQERKTYAKGSTLESTTGYVVKVGMPVVDDTVKATSNGATFTENAPLTDGQYLVTIEVNGEAVAYKESVTADSGITVGDYSVAENAGKIVLTGASANDIVRLLIEPHEVSVSDGFRAAVNKAAPKSEGELPSITDADDGKILTVEVTKGKGAVIVPEQSVNVGMGAPTQLSNTVDDLFVEGAKVIMTVDGVEYAATVEDVGGTVRAVYDVDGNSLHIISFTKANASGSHVKIDGPKGTHTVSVNIEDSNAGWVAQTPSGALVVTDTDGTLDKTWQEIHDAPFAVLVKESDGYKECAMLSNMSREGRAEPYSYNVTFGDDATYTASSADGYPSQE